MSDPVEPCEHLRPGAWPLRVRLTLDEHLGFTDALVSCEACGRWYLLEMLDWRGPHRVMRISGVAADHGAAVVKDLSRGSCDVRRAGAELHHLRTLAVSSPRLLLVDAGGPVVEGVVPVPAGTRAPGAGWRELPCDGSWVDYARSKIDTVNG